MTKTRLPTVASALVAKGGTIVIAAVPGKIEDRRTELADFLTGKGWRVLPERNVCDLDIERCGATTKAIIRPSLATEIEAATYSPFTFDDGLVSIIVNESGARIDQLPLMQHALMRTWTIARRLFLLLCDVSPEGKITRRRPKVDEVMKVAQASVNEVKTIVEAFQRDNRNFIVIRPTGEFTQNTRLDVSHEALLRQWGMLHSSEAPALEAPVARLRFSGATPQGWQTNKNQNTKEPAELQL